MQIYNPYQQQFYQPMPQIQNGGFISVQSEEEARAWSVAPGNSITFKDENAPYCYTKTMGFSQFDRPKFEKFRLIKEEEPDETPASVGVNYEEKIGEIKTEIGKLSKRISKLENLNKEEED